MRTALNEPAMVPSWLYPTRFLWKRPAPSRGALDWCGLLQLLADLCERRAVDVRVLAVDTIPPLACFGIVANVKRPAIAADQVDQVLGAGVVEVVRLRARDETHEVAGTDLVLLVADVRDPVAGQDVDPLLVLVVNVQHAAGLSRLEPDEMHADCLQPDGVAERTGVAHDRSIERMRAAHFGQRLH